MAQKRRITPIMVSSEASTAGQLPQMLQQTGPAPATPTGGDKMSQERQAEEAAKVLGPGRHVYVELRDDYNEVSWPRVSQTTEQPPRLCIPSASSCNIPSIARTYRQHLEVQLIVPMCLTFTLHAASEGAGSADQEHIKRRRTGSRSCWRFGIRR